MMKANWETKSIEEVTGRLIDYRGKTPPKTDSGVRLITAKVVKGGRITDEKPEFIASEFYDEWMRRGLPKQWDLLITTEAPLGEVALLRSPEKIALAQRIILLRGNPDIIDQRYYFYALQSEFTQGEFNGRGTGTTVLGIKQSELRKVRVQLPDLPTQRKIAGILSSYDDLIENNLRRIKILEQMAQSLYREWFVHFRFPGHESATFKDSELGRIPEGWEVKSIGDFGNVLTGKTPSKANEDFYGEDVPFLKTPDMHGQMFILGTNEYLSTLGAQSQSKKTLPVGSICVSCIGTIGVVSITTEPCQTNQQINSVALHNETSREFLFLWLREAKQLLENLGSNGATMGNVNKSKFEGMKLVRPSINELAKFHKYAEPMFCQIEQLLRKIQTLRRTRDLLLPKLLSANPSGRPTVPATNS